MQKSADAYRTISEVADELKLPQHVLRFWETRFPQVKPMKRGGNRRFYRPEDVDLLRAIKVLLYGDGYTIKGVQRILKDQGPRAVTNLVQTDPRRMPMIVGEPPLAAPQRGGNFDDTPKIDHWRETDSMAKSAGDPPRASAPTPAEPRFDKPSSGRAAPRAIPQAGITSGQLVESLQAVLFELGECERILAAARQ